MDIETDVCIVGAGPAGTTTALFLEKYGIGATLVDRALFPRDKICGESFDGHVTHTLRKLNPELLSSLRQTTVLDCRRYSLCNSRGKKIEVNFPPTATPRLVGRRLHFDQFLTDQLRQSQHLDFLENTRIRTAERTAGGWQLSTDSGERLTAKLLVWAAGANSPLGEQLASAHYRPQDEYLFARGYFSDILPTSSELAVEIFFVKKPVPICVVLCPVSDSLTNVEIGLNKLKAQQHRLNVRKLFPDVIEAHPELRRRFGPAILQGKIKGVNMKLPSFRPRYSGEGYLLAGDSAASINPVTGYGVGHAMAQGMLAAEAVQRSLAAGDFSAKFLQEYDRAVYKKLGREIRLGRWFTASMRYIPLLDELIAVSSLQKIMERALSHSDFADRVMRPLS